MNADHLLGKINEVILNPLIVLIFALALLIFFFGVFQFIQGADNEKSRGEGKKKILYGLVGMFIMFSAYGLVHLVLATFNIPAPKNNPLNI